MAMKNDSDGLDILESRLQSAVEQFDQMLLQPQRMSGDPAEAGQGFVVTGSGTSAAHARYLVYLINSFGGGRAEYRPLSAFRPWRGSTGGRRESDSSKSLVLISQSLSPNARLALYCREAFERTFVLTSVSPRGLQEQSDEASLRLFAKLQADGVTFMHFPMENEHSTLLKLVGPFHGYVACYRFTSELYPGSLPAFERNPLMQALKNAEAKAQALHRSRLDDLRGGLHIISGYPLSFCGQNLGLKFIDGLFYPMPQMWDFLDFSRGPLQKLKINKRPVWILQTKESEEGELVDRTTQVLQLLGIEPFVIQSDLPPEISILEFELVFNYFILKAIKKLRINQIDWPAKGLEAPLYDWGQGIEKFVEED